MAKQTVKTTDTDEAPKKKSGAERHMAVWLLMAMIVTGLGGWGVTNFGSNVAAIGKVGSREIPADDYARGLKQMINNWSKQLGMDLTLDQAQAFGLDRQVLQSLVLRSAMDAEADRLGLSVGDTVVAEQVKANKAFQGANGFDREAYRLTLQQNGLTEKSYESGIRGDISRQLLKGAVSGGILAPQVLVETVYAYQNETRGFSVVQLTEAGLPVPIAAPSDADLTAFYTTHIADFTRPAGKKITYAALLPEALIAGMKVDAAAVQALYDARADQYHVPEKRLVERLAYPDDAAAKAAKARLDGGTASFEDLVKDRGLALTDIDMGDVSKTDLAQAGDAVFALADHGVAGPLPSPIGPALYRVNGVLAGQDTSFEAAKADLTKEVALEAAKKAISDKVEAIDDALAGGATLEDLAKEQGMVLATTDYAPGADDNDPLSADPAFAAEAAKIAVGDYPEAVALQNGGLIALREEAEVPAAPVPMDKIKDKVTAAWHADQLHMALTKQADDAKAKVEAGASLGSLGVATIVQPLTRDKTLTDMPADVLKAAFGLTQGQVQLVDTANWVGLVRLDAVLPAAKDGDAAKAARDQIAAQIRKGLGDDVNALYGQALISQEKVNLDQAAINAVNASYH